jgi:hypothetical protein
VGFTIRNRALPVYLRKSSAVPAVVQNPTRGSAAGGIAATIDSTSFGKAELFRK